MNSIDSNEFNRLYCRLSDKEKDDFKYIVLDLFKVNFLLEKKKRDKYLFILSHKELFRLYFSYIDIEFIIREDKELAYIKSLDSNLSRNLSKNETICLLVLRLLYQEKIEEVSLSDEIEIKVIDLQNKLYAVRFEQNQTDRVKKSTLIEMLQVFKAHDLIYYKNDDLKYDNSTIVIYPSIEVATDFREMTDILNRLESLDRGENYE